MENRETDAKVIPRIFYQLRELNSLEGIRVLPEDYK